MGEKRPDLGKRVQDAKKKRAGQILMEGP